MFKKLLKRNKEEFGSNFIYGDFIEDLSLCDDIIKFHEMNPNKGNGVTVPPSDSSIKKSTDSRLSDNQELLMRYDRELSKVLEKYKEKYKFCNEYGAWRITSPINIQHYKPGEGFFVWHTERARVEEPMVSRHLVFMTYLNDVTDGGETEWYYQKLKIKPRKGYTVIWTSDWTHTHRGLTSPTQEKYIVTGWFNYVK